MTAARQTGASRAPRVLAAVHVFAWEDASALQYLVQGSFRPDWIALVPPHLAVGGRPAWIPRHADSHQLANGEMAYTWRNNA